jgi:hypothetical protein
MLDTHEKVKNALSNGAEETPADPEVVEIGDTAQVPILGGDDFSGFKFGPVKPAKKMKLHHIPTFGRQAPETDSSDEDPPLKKPAPKP